MAKLTEAQIALICREAARGGHGCDTHRWRFETLQQWIDRNNDQIHDALWNDVQPGTFETPDEAIQRNLPREAKLGLHLRLVEATPYAPS